MLPVGEESVSERELFVISVPDIASLPERFSLPSLHFVVLLALDALVVGDDDVRCLARNLINSGCAFFTSWGPDCERVHDLFETAIGILVAVPWQSLWATLIGQRRSSVAFAT